MTLCQIDTIMFSMEIKTPIPNANSHTFAFFLVKMCYNQSLLFIYVIPVELNMHDCCLWAANKIIVLNNRTCIQIIPELCIFNYIHTLTAYRDKMVTEAL